MTLEIRWYDDSKTIIYQRYVGDWTLEETYQMIDITYTMMMSVTHLVDVITDMSKAGNAPNLLTSSRYVNQHIAPNSGTAYLIESGDFMEGIVQVAHRLVPKFAAHLDTAESVKHAIQKIQRQRGIKGKGGN
ncbi:MAG: hypothetical protein ACOYL5_14080 [Phototrophicaceae bacterium]